MTTITRRTARFGAALILAIAAVAIVAPGAGASPASPPPKLSGKHMHWYHWHPFARAPQLRTAGFGSTVVLGLESMDDLAPVRSAYGLEHVRAIPSLHAAEVRVNDAQLRSLLAIAAMDPRIRYVSPVGKPRGVESMPNDPLVRDIDAWSNLPYEWQFAATRVDRAFDFSPGNPRVVVGVIDTGVADVPDLAGKIDELWGFAHDGTPTLEPVTGDTDTFGHGTAVASLIAANVNDGFGMAGFGGASHVIAFSACPEGLCPDTSVAIALMKLDSLGVRIVNMSLGSQSPNEPPLVDAIHKAAVDGVLIVASAGNAHSHVGWPAADLQPFDGLRGYGLAVGATNVDGKLAEFSNFGSHLSLVAPGNYLGLHSGVLVALPTFTRFDEMGYQTFIGAGGAHYGYINGTSFAAPEVAGVAALIWAARPELKNYQVADIIKQSARRDPSEGWTPTMGCGLLDAGAALELATSHPAAAWAEDDVVDTAACSAEGNGPPAWPEEADQTIAFDPLLNKTFSDPDFAVGATASSGLPVSFSAGGNCTISGVTVHLTGAGSCTITASQAGDAKYSIAPSVTRGFLIAPAPVAITASGRWGAKVRLAFRVSGASGPMSAKVAVQKNGTTVVQLSRELISAESGSVYALAWRAPKASSKGIYRFCVALTDVAGATSQSSCASIRLR